MRISFSRVCFLAAKVGKCEKCGKRVRRTKTFWKSISRWNRNEDGSVRTREEIYIACKKEGKQWESEPIFHLKCEC